MINYRSYQSNEKKSINIKCHDNRGKYAYLEENDNGASASMAMMAKMAAIAAIWRKIMLSMKHQRKSVAGIEMAFDESVAGEHDDGREAARQHRKIKNRWHGA